MSDTKRLEWLIFGNGARACARVQGNDHRGWRVFACNDGLTLMGTGPTFREAMDKAMEVEPRCSYCRGNDRDMPCAYPSEGKAGCLRDWRLSVQSNDALQEKL